MADTIASSTPGQSDKELIDRIVYLASLASEPQVLDPILDTLRLITAGLEPGQALTREERRKLLAADRSLEDYLINHDPLRRFTHTSLQGRVRQHGKVAQQPRRMDGLQRGLLITWASAILAAAVVLTAPSGLSVLLRASIALPVFILVMHIGGAWFYWSALHDFNAHIRRAYSLIVLGIVVIGLSAAQFPFITSMDISHQPLLLYGGTIPLFTFAIFLFYLAMRSIAKRLKITSRAGSLPLLAGCSALLAVFVTLLPHPTPIRYEAFFDLSMVCDLLVTLLCVFGAILAYKIYHNTTAAYGAAIRFFYYTLIIAAINVTWYGACLFVFGELDLKELIIAMAPHGLTEVMIMTSGYIFRRRVGA